MRCSKCFLNPPSRLVSASCTSSLHTFRSISLRFLASCYAQAWTLVATDLHSCPELAGRNVGNKSCVWPRFTQIPTLQATNCTSCLAMPHTSKSQRQHIVHLAMPRTDASKSPARNSTSCHASHRCQQITGSKAYILLMPHHRSQELTGNIWYILQCLTSIPASHTQKSHILPCPTRISQETNRTSCQTPANNLLTSAQIPRLHDETSRHMSAKNDKDQTI